MTDQRIKELEQEVTLLSQLHTTVCNQRDAALLRIQQLTMDKEHVEFAGANRIELLEELATAVAIWFKGGLEWRQGRRVTQANESIIQDNERGEKERDEVTSETGATTVDPPVGRLRLP